MTITSVNFMLFLLVLFLVFYACSVKSRWKVLLAGSVLFYLLAGAKKLFPCIVLTSAAVWYGARRIGALYAEQEEKLKAEGLDRSGKRAIKEQYKSRAKRILMLTLVWCVGILCVSKFAKYAVLYMDRISMAVNGTAPFSALKILVPLGISYYTFSTVGYLLDVYWKRYEPEKSFWRFFLYAIYFPHIIQGPISRYNLLGQELKKELRFDSRRAAFGMELMLWGLFKKLVIADRLNVFVSAVYNGQDQAGSIFLIAMLFDAFQIYTDFSGYTDIVRGVSQIFGVELEQNFNHPFFSKTVPEYWRRWHMSLGSWFKDYVYYPCSVSHWVKQINRKAKNRFSERACRLVAVIFPVYVTWVLTGLWHGTGMTYLCWGIYYGTLITISSAFQPEFRAMTNSLRIRTETFFWQLFRMLRTFCCFMGGRVLTRPGSLHNTKIIIKNILMNLQPMRLFDGTICSFGLGRLPLALIFCSLVVLWVVSMLQERMSVREALEKQNIVIRWVILFAAIFSILIFGVYGRGYDVVAFMYQAY